MKEIIKSIPKESVDELTKFAIETLRSIFRPLTSTTNWVGMLVENKFSHLNEIQKIIAAESIRKVKEKIERSAAEEVQTSAHMKPEVFYLMIENVDAQVDEVQSEVWTNVVAREIVNADIHPEIARIIAKLTTKDILLLAQINEKQSNKGFGYFLTKMMNDEMAFERADKSFNHFYLRDLGLIIYEKGIWVTTYAGCELLASIQPLD